MIGFHIILTLENAVSLIMSLAFYYVRSSHLNIHIRLFFCSFLGVLPSGLLLCYSFIYMFQSFAKSVRIIFWSIVSRGELAAFYYFISMHYSKH
jgi:hypothetical protein